MSHFLEELGLSLIENKLYITNPACNFDNPNRYIMRTIRSTYLSFPPSLFPNAKSRSCPKRSLFRSDWKLRWKTNHAKIGFEKLPLDEEKSSDSTDLPEKTPERNLMTPQEADGLFDGIDKDLIIGRRYWIEFGQHFSYSLPSKTAKAFGAMSIVGGWAWGFAVVLLLEFLNPPSWKQANPFLRFLSSLASCGEKAVLKCYIRDILERPLRIRRYGGGWIRVRIFHQSKIRCALFLFWIRS